MKILLITDGIMPFVLGGMQKHSTYLAKYLSIQGCKITLVHCVDKDKAIPNDEVINHSIFNDNKTLDNIISLKFPYSIKFPGHYIYNSYRYSKLVYKAIKDNVNNYDFIYVKGFAGWKLLKEKKKGNIFPKIGIKFHGMNMFLPVSGMKSKISKRMLVPFTKYNMNLADYIFSYGGKVTNTIINTGVSNNNIIEIPTGIDKSWINNNTTNSKNKNINFIFCGRYDLIKGIKILYDVIDSFKEKDCNFHFIGPFSEDIKIKQSNIIYHGYIKDENRIKEIYDFCDILILPSYSEGMPNVILEAMSRGLGIIATDVGAISLLVDERNGNLIAKPDFKLIKNVIREFINMDKEKLLEIKNTSIVKIEQLFVWDNIAKKLIKEISAIVQEK
jgi:glycosyltransferase involved in cell wall biosynthesis